MPQQAIVDPRAALDANLAAIINHFRAESGTIHLLNGTTLSLKAMHGNFPPPVMDAIRTIPVGKGMAGLAAQRREPVTACNLQTDTTGDVRPGAKATGMEGAIVVPMIGADGAVHGTLGIANRAARTWTKEESDALIECGRALAASA